MHACIKRSMHTLDYAFDHLRQQQNKLQQQQQQPPVAGVGIFIGTVLVSSLDFGQSFTHVCVCVCMR